MLHFSRARSRLPGFLTHVIYIYNAACAAPSAENNYTRYVIDRYFNRTFVCNRKSCGQMVVHRGSARTFVDKIILFHSGMFCRSINVRAVRLCAVKMNRVSFLFFLVQSARILFFASAAVKY